MKKALLLLLSSMLAFSACHESLVPDAPSKDGELTGRQFNVSLFKDVARKVFVLNEGSFGANNATLDFLRLSDGNYINDAFGKMNPDAGAGLGDVANDIAVHGDEVWIVVNNSGIVEVLSARDETEIAAITIPTPRNIAFDDKYAYVSSWAGAFVNGGFDASGNYIVNDSVNPKGKVYRINLRTKKIDGTVEVGFQPEGLACYAGKLYVANSGGISSQLPPDWSYDNTVSIIDTKSFKVTGSTEIQINLKNVYSDGAGHIYVTTLGDYNSIPSGLYMFETDAPNRPWKVSDHVTLSAIYGDTVYCIGTETEFDWSATHTYDAWTVKNGSLSRISLNLEEKTPYCLAVLSPDVFLIGDAYDYFNPGTIGCYIKGEKRWDVLAGVCPGHIALW